MTAQKLLLEIAIIRSNNLKPNAIFIVQDLFEEDIWNFLPVNVRCNLGKDFFNHINQPLQNSIAALCKTTLGQQIYECI